MAARQHRCRRMLPCQLQPLVLALALAVALSLAVALPGAAAGNDVISLTKADSVHGLLQLDQDNADAAESRQSRPGNHFDYGAYANDFNLQEEASIPEDIFDQHDGDIKDTDSQLHYAPAASEATAVDDDDDVDVDVDDDAAADATDAADAGHAEDAIGSAWSDADDSAPWHEDGDEKENDASEAADIILESQMPTTRNFTVQLDTKETFKRKKFSSQKPNASQVIHKLGNKKDRQQPKRLVNEGAVKEEQEEEDDEEAKATEASTDNAKLERKRIRYTKLREMHEQRSQQKEQEPKQQDQGTGRTKWQIGEKGEKREREEQLVDSIEILNERKCNKPSGEIAMEQQLDPEQDTFQIEKKNEKEAEMERVKDEDEKTFGDIEDNFDGDKVIDIDESSKNQESPPEATAATKITSTGSGEATMPPTVAMIGRKEKRGFFRMYRPDLMAKYFDKFDEPDNTPVNVEDEDLDAPVGKLHYFENGGKPQEQQQPAQKELPTRTENGTQQQQPESRYTDDQNAEEQQPPQEPREDRLVSIEMRSSETESDTESEIESALQQFQETVTVPATTIAPISATPSSAFELFKALRRSHQKAGHKSHKKRYKDYLKRHHQSLKQPLATPPPPPPSLSPRHAQKLLEEQERERERAHSAPIFALGIRPRSLLSTDKPFYEGRVYYYDHPQGGMAMQQDLEEQQQTTEMERLIAHDNDNWYRRISPILRNGVKSGRGEQHPHHQQKHQHHQSQKGHHQHQYKQHHNHHHSHHHHHNSNNHHNPDQKVGQLLQRSNNPYQRRAHQTPAASLADSPSSSVATPPLPPLPPLPPPTQQLGHQITELEHLERYYAKWPHLARVQFQLYDEQREPQQQPLLYGDYGDDYESAAELEEAQEEQGEEANLPPYIKKYNRRNKQLLNLLEGTLPPPVAPPIPSNPISGSDSATTAVRLDDEYLKQKRRHYRQQHRFKDLFAEQRVETTTMAASPPVTGETSATLAKAAGNQLPDEDGYVDSDEEQQKPPQQTFWQREMANKAVAPVDPPSSTPPSPVTTPKPALFKLPSYPAIAGSFLGAPRSRSRSAQFVANVAGRGQSSSRPRYDTSNGAKGAGESGESSVAASPLNSFVYHRVVDGIGGNSVLSSGVGGSNSRKQSRLPFVAITDRRLETMASKRLLAERHKDFEQNHFPMP
ncbi:uncharacterized protein LOC117901911 [Drosophila subobscura]|uniref:uncharacterized protein LOC117901911 n=1 Tax=Drosophila subobscura TaxID=7241 RepID=UPI00155A0BB1|nr:uncharacterized protein LOC117901911 [Drosophila subobscura]